MLAKEKLERLSQLAQLKKEGKLTKEEEIEQAELRKEYLSKFRQSMRNHIEGIKVVDKEGRDITPKKLKAVQKEKGIHQRHLEGK
ncbi:DUF896 domain-containing protein [Atopobacter sp. AH10]|uniref:DUF896 domain-containing protein n=1 Tax=Atopobacter sp. AH10 TaxID=2315861 RepID=UPI000EF17C13|nr:DUF896 domain-containing protein [Atopobacter sp. AH10]RLK62509.1 DUF896 domain-containing protein [Atopobacter sp. AH10]